MLTKAKMRCRGVVLKMSPGDKRGWKFLKLLFLLNFLYCKRPSSDSCLDCGWRCPFGVVSEALSSEHALDWFVEHVNMGAAFFPFAKSRDVFEVMLLFGVASICF